MVVECLLDDHWIVLPCGARVRRELWEHAQMLDQWISRSDDCWHPIKISEQFCGAFKEIRKNGLQSFPKGRHGLHCFAKAVAITAEFNLNLALYFVSSAQYIDFLEISVDTSNKFSIPCSVEL